MTKNSERLTISEVAEITRESAFTIRKRCRDGVLPAAKHGRSWWVLRRDLDDYLAATNTEPAENDKPRYRTAAHKRRAQGGGPPTNNRPSPKAIREAGWVLAVEDVAALSRTPREQAELAYTPTGPSVDELGDRIRKRRGLEPLDRSKGGESDS